MGNEKSCPAIAGNFYGISAFVLGNPSQSVGRVIDDPQGPRFSNPKQMLSYPGAKFTWTADLQEVYDNALEHLGIDSFAHLDLFGGSGIVTFMVTELYGDHLEMLTRSVYNDGDQVVTGVLKALKQTPNEMKRKVQYYLEKIRQDAGYFAHLRTIVDAEDQPILNRAAAKMVVSNISYLYKGLYYRADMAKFKLPMMQRKLDELDTWTNVFSRVSVWQKPWKKALQDFIEQNPGNRVVFLDPPYLPKKTKASGQTNRDYYDVSMTLSEHVWLADQVHSGNCTYILTHNDEPAFRAIYGTADVEYTRKKMVKTNTPSVKAYTDNEVVMINYQRS